MSSNPTSTTSTARARRTPLLHTRRGRAGLAGSAVLLAALPLLAACSAGTNPQVYQIVPNNGHGTSGYMYIANVWVVFDQSTGNAEIIGQVANTDPTRTDANQLTGVSLGGVQATITAPADTSKLAPGVAIAGNTVNIPALKAVNFGQPGQPEIEIPNAALTVGSNAEITYKFSSGDSISVVAIVEPNSGLWKQYNPNGSNTASPSATGTGTATATAGASLSPTLTGSASPQTSVATGTATPTGAATGTATATASGTATASPSATH